MDLGQIHLKYEILLLRLVRYCKIYTQWIEYITANSLLLSNNSDIKFWYQIGIFFRYKKYFDEGKLEKALEICREYLNRLDELKVKYPHRNYEIATIALCSCLWGMTQPCWWHLHNVMQIVLLPSLATFYVPLILLCNHYYEYVVK